ncbi:hypothetical protein RHGRI_021047 [Rhododendron griersonianum]|uniref:Reverse transcriptase n=1 Tax=Rhododendron griersonianum TaxID=479676 RepID=A0AAV6JPT5_9ERIC|nr:hypothetical protein RHGRI_021047 [Rhododendron griersonianum]
METKNKRSTLDSIRRRLQFNNGCCVDPIGKSGGLALWWSDEVTLDVRFSSKNLFRCIVKWPRISNPFLITFVYPPPIWNERLRFWNQLKSIARENSYPWICVGDLNEVGTQAEKQGAILAVKEGWNNTTVLFRTVGSDHCPLVVKYKIPLKKVPFSFKFEAKWTTHPECNQVIEVAWNQSQIGSHLFGLVQKLKKCREALMDWSKKTFGKDKMKLKLLQERLRIVQAEPFLQENLIREREIVKEIEVLLLREEMALHQRARVNWLSFGDKNSAFFHACMNQRRQRNQLLMLKTGGGNWVEDEDGINDLIYDYFSGLFESSGARDFSKVLATVNNSISDE